MNTAMIEQAIVQELHDMPPEAAQEVLDFALFIKQRRQDKQDVCIPKRRKAGALKGQIKLSDDFNAPLDDFAECHTS